MEKIKFDMQIMQIMSTFSRITHAELKDCIVEDAQILFIVQEGMMGKAIGKKGANIRKLEHAFKKTIKLVEFKSNVISFISSMIYPLRLQEAKEEGDTVTLTAADTKTRGMIIGRAAANLRALETVVKRYFPIKEIKVN